MIVLIAAENVAFSTILDTDIKAYTAESTLIFRTIVTNIGSAYDAATGYFTAPSDGTYGFAWTILTFPGKSFNSYLVKDGNTTLHNAANSNGGKGFESSGCTGILQLKAGQRVWLRGHGNDLHSPWCSFSGWRIQ